MDELRCGCKSSPSPWERIPHDDLGDALRAEANRWIGNIIFGTGIAVIVMCVVALIAEVWRGWP